MYGVIALFDEQTNQFIQQLWKELKDHSISNYAYEVVDRKPHITLASYNDICNKSAFIEQLDEFYSSKNAISISFQSIGSFLNSGALYFSPTVTSELLDLHHEHHIKFHQYNSNRDSLYLPGKWIPHCTIANRLSKEKLAEAYLYCLDRVNLITGNIIEIALIEVTNSKTAPIIYSKKLLND